MREGAPHWRRRYASELGEPAGRPAFARPTRGATPAGSARPGVRRRALLGSVGMLLGAALTGCGGEGPVAAPSATPTPPPVVKDGHLTLSPLALQCGIAGVTGTHSEGSPRGEFCSLRLRVANPDPEFHTFRAARQRLAGVAAPRDAPDSFAMAVRRQHDSVEIGGHDAIEVELWYDVPKNAPVRGVSLAGDADPEGFGSTRPVAHALRGVLVRLSARR